ncbi:putative transcriptional activator SRCAP-like protein [Actinokineospora spheciospongiae]|uniref:Putative transcriptional activator SRCAP-like protein n=1 Tax=Actinokineospora spheciospongiae TaxID=909613 RepID=W7IG44_9PSEU|nr:DUF6603 domain-containing protein [Actinokineospora spheciospongiae]EWC59870.1 putative transcriptional activator SRCAP-like protein [Actinokineospora spheciospongiae]
MSTPVPRNAQQQLVREVELVLEPLLLAAGGQWHLDALLEALGWDLSALPGGADLTGWLKDVTTAAQGITDLVEDPPQSLEDLVRVLQTAAAAFQAVRSIPAGIKAVDPQAVVRDLVDHLVVSYLVKHHQTLYHCLVLLGVVVPAADAPAQQATSVDGVPVRLPRSRSAVRPEKLLALVTDPVGTLTAEYGGLSLATEASAEAVAAKLLPRLGELLRSLGVESLVGLGDPDGSGLAGDGIAIGNRMLTLSKEVGDDRVSAVLGLTAAIASGETGGLGVVLVPSGAVAVEQVFGGWSLHADLSAAGPGVAIGPQGVTVSGGAPPHIGLTVELRRADGAPPLALGSATGTRLEIGDPRVWVAAELDPPADQPLDPAAQADVEVGVVARKAAVVIAGGDGDGFLGSVLPADGLRAEFELGLVWSRRGGLRFSGSAGLEAALPVHVRLGPLEVRDITVALVAGTDGLRATATGTARVELGPVKATVEKMGIAGTLAPAPGRDGNLGPIAAGAAFEPPKGIAIEVNAGPVTGGGYLFADHTKGEYAGAVALKLQALALRAVGILTTRMPDGSDGFSLLLIVSAEFTPIQLGFGFTLNGVGGLIGVNRRVDTDALRAGLTSGALDSILFPKDPLGKAGELVASLGAVFPVAKGRHVVGPMVKIGWGTPTLVTLDVALLLELPTPLRLAILGKLHMALPSEDKALVVINVDLLGVVDFEQGTAAVDARLRDSRIAAFPISGGLAMRANWLGKPAFALSVGGFHPRFTPPPGFPKVDRVQIALLSGDNPRLRMESYLALTSNTAQIGARVDLYAAALGFSVAGMLSFDALLQFEPFRFEVDIAGSLSLKKGSKQLLLVRVELGLSGPNRWHARGLARAEILFFDVEISFDRWFGKALPGAEQPAAVALLERVEQALADPGSWSAQLPHNGRPAVTVRKVPAAQGTLLAHPTGTLAVTQRVAPLGVTLENYGRAPIAGAKRFDLTSITVRGKAGGTGTALSTEEVREYFAPGEFFALDDSEKLARPSFEELQAGRRTVAAPRRAFDETGFETDTEPEEIVIDAPATATPAALRAARRVSNPVDPASVEVVSVGTTQADTMAVNAAPVDAVPGGAARDPRRAVAPSPAARAAARAAVRRTGKSRFAAQAPTPLVVADPDYAVVGAGLRAEHHPTWTEAREAALARAADAPAQPFTTQAAPPTQAALSTQAAPPADAGAAARFAAPAGRTGRVRVVPVAPAASGGTR